MNSSVTILIYDVSEDYIKLIASFDKEVRIPKDALRPYLFARITLDSNKEYLIPLSSPKKLKFRAKDIIDTIYDIDDMTKIIGYLEYHKMIPFHEDIAKVIDIKQYPDIKYRALLEKDYKYLDEHIGLAAIEKKASLIYKARYNKNHYLYDRYLKDFGTDVVLLEKVLVDYLKTI